MRPNLVPPRGSPLYPGCRGGHFNLQRGVGKDSGAAIMSEHHRRAFLMMCREGLSFFSLEEKIPLFLR